MNGILKIKLVRGEASEILQPQAILGGKYRVKIEKNPLETNNFVTVGAKIGILVRTLIS